MRTIQSMLYNVNLCNGETRVQTAQKYVASTKNFVTADVITAVNMHTTVLSDVPPCSLVGPY